MQLDFLRRAFLEATKSPDLSTQNGAVLVNKGMLISAACNDFPPGVHVYPQRLERPKKNLDESTYDAHDHKYSYTEHAERAVIFEAIRTGMGQFIPGATLYCPFFACPDCARAIIYSGISKVIGHKHKSAHNQWGGNVQVGLRMLIEAGIEMEYFEGTFGDVPKIRRNYEFFQP